VLNTQQKSINWDKENTIFFFYFVLTILLIYFSSNVLVIRVVFLLFLVPIFRSKKDYFWLAWFFLLYDAPGGLLTGGEKELIQRIPMYPIMSGISIHFMELFYMTLLIKAIISRRKLVFVFQQQFNVFWLFAFILVIYTFTLGVNLKLIVAIFRTLLPWSLVFSVSKLMTSENNFYRLCKLLFPIAFISVAIQIISYFAGNDFHSLLLGKSASLYESPGSEEEGLRTISSCYIVLFITITALYYKIKQTREFSSTYLNILIVLTTFSIFITATRGWILAYGFLFLLMVIFLPMNVIIKRIASIVIYGTIFYYVLIIVFPVVGTNAEYAFTRFQTIGALAKGDITAGGTLARLDIRGPLVWKQAKESLIIGYGFSSTYFEHQDGHVAHLNILLNSGIIGTIILNLIYLSFIYSIWKLSKNRNIISGHGPSLKIFAFGLLSIYIIHSSSTQSWGYVSGYIVFVYAFIFGFVNAIVNATTSNKKPISLVYHNYT
jgi:hypothetical protein